jgi:NAD(P)-dependent dehydrogenase (short-subunit alcohol dehydrogenase family)
MTDTAIVTGGSRGYGRGIAEALAASGMRVVAVARDRERLAALARETGGRVEVIEADVTDAVAAARIVQRERPRVLVLNAGAMPVMRATRFQSWETFSVNLEVDVKGAFLWAREALALPLDKGSSIFIVSSTAADSDNPEISGYAMAKAALGRLSVSLATEAQPFDIRVRCLFPVLTTETDLGREAVSNFARSAGLSFDEMRKRFGMDRPLTPAAVGAAVIGLLTDTSREVGFKISANGVEPLSEVARLSAKPPDP